MTTCDTKTIGYRIRVGGGDIYLHRLENGKATQLDSDTCTLPMPPGSVLSGTALGPEGQREARDAQTQRAK